MGTFEKPYILNPKQVLRIPDLGVTGLRLRVQGLRDFFGLAGTKPKNHPLLC